MLVHVYVFAHLFSAAAEVCCVLPYPSLTLHVDTTTQQNRHCDTVNTDELLQLNVSAFSVYVAKATANVTLS
jgi:hypothetical protein